MRFGVRTFFAGLEKNWRRSGFSVSNGVRMNVSMSVVLLFVIVIVLFVNYFFVSQLKKMMN